MSLNEPQLSQINLSPEESSVSLSDIADNNRDLKSNKSPKTKKVNRNNDTNHNSPSKATTPVNLRAAANIRKMQMHLQASANSRPNSDDWSVSSLGQDTPGSQSTPRISLLHASRK